MTVNHHNTVESQKRDCHDFYSEIKEALAVNSTCALNVAGGISESGNVVHMKKGEVTGLVDLSSGTVTSLTSSSLEPVPSLDSICKLAYALNISPAFLLMTPRDWGILLQAFGIFEIFHKPEGEKEKTLLSILEDSTNKRHQGDSVKDGLEFMKQFRSDEYATDERLQQQKGILAMTALAQAAMKRQGKNINMQATALGAFLGDRDLSQNV
jgi:transcriptional regulator with XRE-family HTH domain